MVVGQGVGPGEVGGGTVGVGMGRREPGTSATASLEGKEW